MTAKFHEGNSLLAYDIPKRTQQDLLEEKEYMDYKNNVEFNQGGLPGHLLIGHGQKIEAFENRDLATIKNLSYEDRQKAADITHPMSFLKANTKVDKFQINQKAENVPSIFGSELKKEDIKPRGYNEYTKKLDNNYLKIGLRK